LEECIKRLYEVFKRYDKPKDFPACEHCLSKEKKTRLLKSTLAELETDYLDSYAADVFFTVGSLTDFKYFLPRILDLAVHEKFSWPDPEVSLAKLRLAEWESWPQEERTAILDLLQEKFRCLLDDPKSGGHDLDRWVCALGQCVSDITVYLDQLFEPGREDKLWGFIESNLSFFAKNKLANGFWDSAPESEKRVRDWLNRPQVKALLSDRYGMRP
jgi:hypothetical protein